MARHPHPHPHAPSVPPIPPRAPLHAHAPSMAPIPPPWPAILTPIPTRPPFPPYLPVPPSMPTHPPWPPYPLHGPPSSPPSPRALPSPYTPCAPLHAHAFCVPTTKMGFRGRGCACAQTTTTTGQLPGCCAADSREALRGRLDPAEGTRGVAVCCRRFPRGCGRWARPCPRCSPPSPGRSPGHCRSLWVRDRRLPNPAEQTFRGGPVPQVASTSTSASPENLSCLRTHVPPEHQATCFLNVPPRKLSRDLRPSTFHRMVDPLSCVPDLTG
ncbi:chitin-binding lectin 1-like [Canis lupus familiaris]|uniref:chitin-binding lectin 1-like n=1 Tax=Canis lupus familiaris TaxID=9615 RepID=UPI0018F3AD77|nr:chitin-binding lectin 1-like [Canis lupus familiaris]